MIGVQLIRLVRIQYLAPIISCIVLENSSVHLENALSLTSMSAGTRNELTKRKRNKDVTASPYKWLSIKANNSRVMAIHNKTIQLIFGINTDKYETS